ncbi:MAG: 4'-phosphopantetheinyl transferase superfamily protein, partial [Bacilli bacterium]
MIRIKNVKKFNLQKNLITLEKDIESDKYQELENIESEEYKRNSVVMQKMLVKYYKKHHFALPIKYQYNQHGKPFVKDYDLFFNMSHSANYCAFAVSKYEVGIDIEKLTNKDYSKIIEKVLNDCERDHLKKYPFLVQWTIKESYLKCLGIGLIKNLQDIVIDFDKKEVFYNAYPRLKYKNVTKRKYTYTIIYKD